MDSLFRFLQSLVQGHMKFQIETEFGISLSANNNQIVPIQMDIESTSDIGFTQDHHLLNPSTICHVLGELLVKKYNFHHIDSYCSIPPGCKSNLFQYCRTF